VEAIEVRWSDGTRQSFPGGPVDRVITLHRGGSGLGMGRRTDSGRGGP
jgi:hypothetical protein